MTQPTSYDTDPSKGARWSDNNMICAWVGKTDKELGEVPTLLGCESEGSSVTTLGDFLKFLATIFLFISGQNI